MTRRIPIVATILVGLAVATMIALGVWQLQRRHEKEASLALYATNIAQPPAAFAALQPLDDKGLFREVSASCLRVIGWTVQAGHGAKGETGWSHIAACSTGAEGPGFNVDMGVSTSTAAPQWSGGPVRGRVVWTPDGEPLIARLFATLPPRTPLIVAETAAPGLAPTAPPDPASVPNNHLAYAVQWFLFAGVALVIYGVALWRRRA
ncbi:SURF1 family protein [Sphingomonas sp. BIUV-7]|uniref:SURF1-like protein n=1 Tax=Sphingomonas natans TaxID=3063330 RepID=A0ABT8YBE6_9SPHN|nr:SURF1 family protein [Sphingomonas sp. BIUV-7]MDO6415658.1 SURF1 family protein [Sphingomonas sp. BIUV-7]